MQTAASTETVCLDSVTVISVGMDHSVRGLVNINLIALCTAMYQFLVCVKLLAMVYRTVPVFPMANVSLMMCVSVRQVTSVIRVTRKLAVIT